MNEFYLQLMGGINDNDEIFPRTHNRLATRLNYKLNFAIKLNKNLRNKHISIICDEIFETYFVQHFDDYNIFSVTKNNI